MTTPIVEDISPAFWISLGICVAIAVGMVVLWLMSRGS